MDIERDVNKENPTTMKQKYAVIILFALIIVSGITSFSSYQATERMITEDMKSALTKTEKCTDKDIGRAAK